MQEHIIQIGRLSNKLPALKEFLNGHVWTLKSVRILHHSLWIIPNEDYPKRWPFEADFIIDGKEVRVKMSNIFVGFDGNGAHDIANILDFFKVKYSPDDIFTKKKQNKKGYIDLEYTN